MAYLKQPVVLLRWHVVLAPVIVGILFATGVIAYATAKSERRARIADSEQRQEALVRAEAAHLQAEILTKRELTALTRRVTRQEQPSNAELIRRIARIIRLLKARPALAEKLRSTGARELDAVLVGPVPQVVAKTPSTPLPRHKRKRPPPEHSASPPPPNPPPPGHQQQQPPVDVHTPDLTPLPKVPICTGIADVDCPHG